MSLDKKLNELKKKRKLTNSQLSQITGITISTIDKITSGNNTNPKLRTIESLCKALNCTLDDLLDDNNLHIDGKQITCTILDRNDKEKQRLLYNYEKLSDKGKEKLVEYSDDLVSSKKYIKDKYVTVVKAARNKDGQHSIEKVQMTEEELSIFDTAPQSDEDL